MALWLYGTSYERLGMSSMDVPTYLPPTYIITCACTDLMTQGPLCIDRAARLGSTNLR